jgi:lambda family phage tail tape measure protein
MANIASTITISANAAGVGAATMVIKELGAAIIESVVAEDRMKMMMEAASGSAVLASRDLGYVRDVAQKMGQDLFSAADGFVKLTAATRGTALEGENTRKVFEAFTAANAKLGGSAQDLEGMLRALSQMVNKGVVSMEELRQQLGEKLPGTMRLAADSMNMPVEKLMSLIATGKLATEDFLVPFSEAVNKTFNDGKFETAGQNIQRLKNEWTLLVQEMSDSSWVSKPAGYLAEIIQSMRDDGGAAKRELLIKQLSFIDERLASVKEGEKVYIDGGMVSVEQLLNRQKFLQEEIWKTYSGSLKKIEEEAKAAGDRELVLQAELQEKKLAKQEAFLQATAKHESNYGKDPNTYKPHGSISGMYQQSDAFFKDYGNGGSKSDENERLAAANFAEQADKVFGGDIAKKHAAYMEGVGRIKQVQAEAIETGQNWLVILEKIIDKSRGMGEGKKVVESIISRSEFESRFTGTKMSNAGVRDYEEQQRDQKRASDKALSEEQRKQERITQISITEHNKRLRLEDDTTSDLLEKSKIREANEIKMIQESMQRYKAEGMLTVKIEEDMQAQITNLTKKGEEERNKIQEAAAKKEEERTRREAKDIAAVNKYANDAALELARIEGRKTSAIILQSQIRRKAVEDEYNALLAKARGNAALIIALEQGKSNKIKAINQEEKEALIRTNGSYTDKMKLHFTELERTSGDFTNQVNEGFKDITLNGIDGMTDALTNLATTGKASFKEFALSIIKDIEKMILKALIFKALSAAFGYGTGGGGAVIAQAGQNYAANGAVFDGSNAQFFAEGGVVERATPFAMSNGKTGVMGEAGPEAIMPLARGADGKLGVRGGGSSGGGNNVQVGAINVVVKSDPKSTPNQQGMEIGQAIKKEITQLIRMEVQDMHRPGNSLNQTRRI